MVESSEAQWLQRTFSTLVSLFDRVGLKTNVGKTFGMVCHLCQVSGTQSEVAYGGQMMGAGPLYRESQWDRIQ